MTSHFAKYMEEREGAKTIETEKGFICYKFEDDYCIITDIYIAPEFRNNKVGKEFGKYVELEAKKEGIDKLLCYADKDANNFEDSVTFILKNDYKLFNATEKLVYFKKEI